MILTTSGTRRSTKTIPLLALIALGAINPDTARTTTLSSPAINGVRPDTGMRATASSLNLRASITDKVIYVQLNDSVVVSYPVAVGMDKHPTPRGSFTIRKIVWNPAWIPPDAAWARGKKAKPAGHPKNPMKVVKLYFKEPDYYIHGTGDVESLGGAASHGCLRMAPEDIADLARQLMEAGGAAKSDDWYNSALTDKQTRTIVLPRPISLTIGE